MVPPAVAASATTAHRPGGRIGAGAAMGQGGGNGLRQRGLAVVAMQIEDVDEFPHPTPVRPLPAQMVQQFIVNRRPRLSPAAQRFGMVDGPGPLPDEGQVVQGVDNLLVAVITARMDGQRFGLVGPVEFNREGVQFGRQLWLAWSTGTEYRLVSSCT